MAIMRYKLVGSNMVERPRKGAWVLYEDHCAVLQAWKESVAKDSMETWKNETTGDNKRSSK